MNAVLAGTTIRIGRFRLFQLDRREWELFAHACDASFKCSVYNFGSNLSQFLFGSRTFFALYACSNGIETKIAQCAVRRIDGVFHFDDRLQILPEFDEYWTVCMRLLLSELGTGRYHYGSLWSMDRNRLGQLEPIENVTLVDSTRFKMQYVDFAALPDWDDYTRSLHKNVQRNLKKAAAIDDVRIENYRGLAALKLLQKSSAVRKILFDAKRMPFSKASAALRAAFRILSFRRYAVGAAVTAGGEVVGVFSGIQFGNAMFYIDGGSLPANRGLSWTLLIGMIEAAYKTAPHGAFVFGWQVEGNTDALELIWSRQQCRIVERPSSLFEFTYKAV